MESQHIPMSIEDYELMSHPFGWKAEYWHGQAHLTRRENHVSTKMSLTYREINEKPEITGMGCSMMTGITETY